MGSTANTQREDQTRKKGIWKVLCVFFRAKFGSISLYVLFTSQLPCIIAFVAIFHSGKHHIFVRVAGFHVKSFKHLVSWGAYPFPAIHLLIHAFLCGQYRNFLTVYCILIAFLLWLWQWLWLLLLLLLLLLPSLLLLLYSDVYTGQPQAPKCGLNEGPVSRNEIKIKPTK